MFKNGPVGCLGLFHESGWMTGPNFFLSIKHFHSFVKCSKEDPVVLIMDNHVSHLDFNVVQFAKENGVILLTFPPHCSHRIQPLDISVFGPFKRALSCSQKEWLYRNPGKRISVSHIAELSKIPYERAFSPNNIISGFSYTGIYPFNRSLIPEKDFAPSTVTDIPGKFCFMVI